MSGDKANKGAYMEDAIREAEVVAWAKVCHESRGRVIDPEMAFKIGFRLATRSILEIAEEVSR